MIFGKRGGGQEMERMGRRGEDEKKLKTCHVYAPTPHECDHHVWQTWTNKN